MKNYLQLHLARKPHEVFAALFLDAQNRLITMEELFRGTLAQTSVYPREVVAASRCSTTRPPWCSRAITRAAPCSRRELTRPLTQTLKAALALVDVRVLDHVIVAPGQALSMAEKGLL